MLDISGSEEMKNTNIQKEARQNWRRVMTVAILLCFFSICLASTTASAADPYFSARGISPSSGDETQNYAFILTYVNSDNSSPVSIDVVIDHKEHGMKEVDDTDDNYTDGKSYYYKTKLGPGVHVFYFRANTGNGSISSNVMTVQIAEELFILNGEHRDIIYAGGLLFIAAMLPLAYSIFLLHKTTKNIAEMTNLKASLAKDLEKRERSEKPGEEGSSDGKK